MGVECGVRLACAKYAVFGIDYEGHGRSEGARCYIKKFDNIVNDCYDFFKSVSGKDSNSGLCQHYSVETLDILVQLHDLYAYLRAPRV